MASNSAAHCQPPQRRSIQNEPNRLLRWNFPFAKWGQICDVSSWTRLSGDGVKDVVLVGHDGFAFSRLMELIFDMRDAEEGGFYARALGHAIFTQAETWDQLRANALNETALCKGFFNRCDAVLP